MKSGLWSFQGIGFVRSGESGRPSVEGDSAGVSFAYLGKVKRDNQPKLAARVCKTKSFRPKGVPYFFND